MGLGARLAILFAGVAAATAIVIGGASYLTTGRQVTNEIDDFLRVRAAEIVDGRRDGPPPPSEGRGDRDGNQRDRDGDERGDRQSDEDDGAEPVVVAVGADSEVQVTDRDGTITSNTGLQLPVTKIDIGLARSEGRPIIRTVQIDQDEYRIITAHLTGGGAVQVARSLDEANGLLNVLRTRLLVVTGLLALVAAASGWAVAQRTTRPLRALTSAVDKVAQTRDFSVPVAASGEDEVGRLASGFNRMLGALEVSQRQQHRLVQDAAHELRTPLTSVTANIEWLMKAPDIEPETRVETLAGVRRELRELNDVMSEIIELATDSRDAPELVATDLVAVAHEAVDLFERRTGRRVIVEAAPMVVVGDADSLGRALTNLLNNADKYSPVDAPIGVVVEPGGLFVDDAGPGIPPAERELVFDRFYRRVEDRSTPGSGLGLSIVAGIVDQHGGTVVVSDSPLGGARFGIVLPGAG